MPEFRYEAVARVLDRGVLSGMFAPETTAPKLGEKLRLVPGHCDPTVDRYDWYVGYRGDRVECLWPVAARGANA